MAHRYTKVVIALAVILAVAAAGDASPKRSSRTHGSTTGRRKGSTLHDSQHASTGLAGAISGMLSSVNDKIDLEALHAFPQVMQDVADMTVGPKQEKLRARKLKAYQPEVELEYLEQHKEHFHDEFAAALESLGRRLASGPCSDVGREVTTTTPTYECGGAAVTLAQYDAILALQNTTFPPNVTLGDATVGNFTFGNITFPPVVIPPVLVDVPVANVSCSTGESSVTACACPLSYNGTECEIARSVTCESEVVDEGYQACRQARKVTLGGYNPHNDGDPPCFILTERTRLTLQMKCSFDAAVEPKCNGTVIDEATREGQQPPFYGLQGCVEESFSYWSWKSDGSFAVSDDPGDLSLTLRPYNFNKLSDTSGSKEVTLTATHLTGAQLSLAFPLSGVPQTSRAGGRIVLEITGSSKKGLAFKSWDFIVDEQGYQPPAFVPEDDYTALIVVIAVAVVLVAAWAWWARRRKQARENQRLHKME